MGLDLRKKIGLANAFGKAAAATATAAGAYVYFELARLIINATDTSQDILANPSENVVPALIAFGVCMGAGIPSIFAAHKKKQWANEFNYQVELEMENMGFALADDEPKSVFDSGKDKSSGSRWVKREPKTIYVERPHNDGFWTGYLLGSWGNSGRSYGGSSYSSSSKSRSSSSSSSSGKGGQGMAYVIAIAAVAAAAAASAYVSYRSIKGNFFEKTPDLLVGEEPDVFDVPAQQPQQAPRP